MVQNLCLAHAAGPLWSGTFLAHMLQDHYGPEPLTGPYAAEPLWSGTYGWPTCCRTVIVQDLWLAHG